MKTILRSPRASTVRGQKRHAKNAQPGLQRGHNERSKTNPSRVQQKTGAYKRIDLFLGVEAAIALRQLMRDGRSAREVIETLLLAEKQRNRPGCETLGR